MAFNIQDFITKQVASAVGSVEVPSAAKNQVLNGLTDDEITVHLIGGDLLVRWDRQLNRVFMSGPAATVFEGEIDISQCPVDDPPHVVDPSW